MEGVDLDLNITLHNACGNVDCYWHTTHWGKVYRNGCYMLKDISKCEEPTPFKEGLKKEYPEPFKVSEIKPLTDKQRIEICKSTKQKLIDAERFTSNKGSYDKVDSNAVEDAICMLGDYIEMLEALIEVKRRQRTKELGRAIEKMKEEQEHE